MSSPKPIEHHSLAEVQNRLDNVANMTAIELMEHIILGNFTISDMVHPDDVKRLNIPVIQRWIVKVMPATESRNSCIVMITPHDDLARQVWTHGQITIALKAGLPYENAVLWANSSNRSKHRWLKLVVRCLSKPKLVVAYEEFYKNRNSPDFNFLKWAKDNDIEERMPAARRVAFVNFLRECAGIPK